MNLFLHLIVIAIVIAGGLLFMALRGKPVPEGKTDGEETKIRQLYPDDPNFEYGEDNTPIWRVGKAQNN